MTEPLPSDLEERFMARVSPEPNTGCWLWTGGVQRRGYGAVAVSHGDVRPAHRVAYLLFRGPIAAGMDVCHSCDNPPCVNPAHLWIGTRSENIRDMDRKGRRPPVLSAGVRNGRALIDETCAREIIAALAAGEPPLVVARRLGVSPHITRGISRGRAWRHLKQ
jgi:hypothetical protein